ILAAIIIPVVGKVRQTSLKAQAISRLHQVGVAILTYRVEHRDRVPGPGGVSQNWRYGRATEDCDKDGRRLQLAPAIGPYMSYPDRSTLAAGRYARVKELQNPGFMRLFPGQEQGKETIKPNYIQNAYLRREGKTRLYVLGWYDAARDKLVQPPFTEADTAEFGGPSRVWILTELDLCLKDDNPAFTDLGYSADWYQEGMIPSGPVWGDTRNRLYFDGHVASVPRNAGL
ncbi:MAG: type II secretion system protein, partial [Opitutaceae bacterium]|nr:type II secretion system protein [Opitutaceae bacterium]